MAEPTTPLCAWSGDAGELRKDAAGSRVICDHPEGASNHQHSMLCPREHEPELICHGFVAPVTRGLIGSDATLERLDAVNQRVSQGIGEGLLGAARWRDALIDVGNMLDDLINDLPEPAEVAPGLLDGEGPARG